MSSCGKDSDISQSRHPISGNTAKQSPRVSRGNNKVKHEIFEDTIRLMVATGSGIVPSLAVRGFDNDTAPKTGLFSSITMLNQKTMGLNPHYQYIGDFESYSVNMVFAETRFQIDWFREGALERAIAFRDWIRSESGLSWAATANVDGRVRAFNVYYGGRGYRTGDRVIVVHGDGDADDARDAEGTIEADTKGEIVRIYLDKHGDGYKDIPRLQSLSDNGDYPYFRYIPITEGDPTPVDDYAQISALGFGLSVKNLDSLNLLKLDENIDGGRFEERIALNLVVCHTYLYIDRDSGRIEVVAGDIDRNGYKDKFEYDVSGN